MPALLKVLAPLLDLSGPTAYGSTLAQVAAQAETPSGQPAIIWPLEDPLAPTGGIVVLRGNLAPNGAVVKASGVHPSMMRHEGPARVLNCEKDVQECLLGGRVSPGDVLVVRYEGPCVGHVCPEAAVGGPLAALRDGDTIEIDIPNRTLHVRLDDEELRARLEEWQPPARTIPAGFLRLYADCVGPASQGAVLGRQR